MGKGQPRKIKSRVRVTSPRNVGRHAKTEKVNSSKPRSQKDSNPGKAKSSKRHRAQRRKPGFRIPITSSPDLLPLYNPEVSWKRFEAFCRDFVSNLTGVAEVHAYGKQGSKQKGIDLFADLSNGERWAFQCKQVKKFTNGDAQKAIKKTKYAANRYFILVSCDVDSTVETYFLKEGNGIFGTSMTFRAVYDL